MGRGGAVRGGGAAQRKEDGGAIATRSGGDEAMPRTGAGAMGGDEIFLWATIYYVTRGLAQ